MNRFKLALAAAAALATFGMSQAHATVVVGAGAQSENCAPFGCDGYNGPAVRYQQVYAASDFSGPLQITGLTFYNSYDPYTPDQYTTLYTGSVTVGLSTTSAQVDGLSDTFDSNVGANNQVLFTGDLPSLAPGGTFTLNLTGAFNYDPTQGNLLMDVKFDGLGTANGVFLNAFDGSDPTKSANGVTSRATDFNDDVYFAGYGLETGFVTGGVPEPASWALMIAGFGLAGAALRRRRSVAAFA